MQCLSCQGGCNKVNVLVWQIVVMLHVANELQ